MTWTIEFTKRADKSLDKIDTKQATKIVDFLKNKIALCEDPKIVGSALTGNLAGHWRYRVGDYRIICEIDNQTITILVIDIGYRREIYR